VSPIERFGGEKSKINFSIFLFCLVTCKELYKAVLDFFSARQKAIQRTCLVTAFEMTSLWENISKSLAEELEQLVLKDLSFCLLNSGYNYSDTSPK